MEYYAFKVGRLQQWIEKEKIDHKVADVMWEEAIERYI